MSAPLRPGCEIVALCVASQLLVGICLESLLSWTPLLSGSFIS